MAGPAWRRGAGCSLQRTAIPSFSVALLACLLLSAPASAAELLPLRDVLADGVDVTELERQALRRPTGSGLDTLFLEELHVLRFEDLRAWGGRDGPALLAALEEGDPRLALEAWLAGHEDAHLLGPDSDGVRVRFDVLGDLGVGVVDFVPPPLFAEEVSGLEHGARFRVASGVSLRPPEAGAPLLGATVEPRPRALDADPPPRPRPPPLQPKHGWAEFLGQRPESSSEQARMADAIDATREASTLSVRRGLDWPGGSRWSAVRAEALRSTSVGAEVLASRSKITALREPESEQRWRRTDLRHPVKVGVSTLSLGADVEVDGRREGRGEVLVFATVYTPLFVTLERAPLLIDVPPREFVAAVRAGELPFFDVDGDAVFFVGHLREWSQSGSGDSGGATTRLSDFEDQVEGWIAALPEGRAQRRFDRIARDRSHWPLRLAPRSRPSSTRSHNVRLDPSEVAGWLRWLFPPFSPPGGAHGPVASVLPWTGRGHRVDLGSVFGAAPAGGERVVMSCHSRALPTVNQKRHKN